MSPLFGRIVETEENGPRNRRPQTDKALIPAKLGYLAVIFIPRLLSFASIF